MKKCTSKILAILLVFTLALSILPMAAFAAENVPTNLRWEDGVAKWDKVEGISRYAFYLYKNGEQILAVTNNGTSRNLNPTLPIYGSGDYTFAVAIKNGSTTGELSELSPVYSYTAPATAITNVQLLGVTAPADGNTANYEWTVQVDTGIAAADVKSAWGVADALPTTLEEMKAAKWYGANEEFKFELGKYYVFCANAVAEDGYVFDANAKAFVDGKKAAIEVVDDTNCKVYFAFSVARANVSEIVIESAPSKTEYKYGKSVSTDGLKVTAVYTNGKTEDVTAKVTITNYDSTIVGNRQALVTYSENAQTVTATFDYTIEYTFWQKIVNFFRNLFK